MMTERWWKLHARALLARDLMENRITATYIWPDIHRRARYEARAAILQARLYRFRDVAMTPQN